ncbi:MAG: diguanylate cyclase domain-containing protein, partial [Candidatus Dormibacteria bacterium]
DLRPAQPNDAQLFASLARRLGSAADVPAVAGAALEVCRETFPQATAGAVLINDEVDGLLKSPGVSLQESGLVRGEPPIEMTPGEGLAGAVFTESQPTVWETALDVSRAHRNLREANRQRMRSAHPGFVHSAIGAPLDIGGGDAIGTIVLTCHTHERAWTHADVHALQIIAAETARNLERASRYQSEAGHAAADPVTGLTGPRGLRQVLEKEVARATRGGDMLAVLMSDIAGLRTVNHAWGPDAGNRLLALFSDVLRVTLRREDTAARIGADEFACVLPGADQQQASAIAERIAARFADITRDDPVAGGLPRVSTGTAVFPTDGVTAAALIGIAQRRRDAIPGDEQSLTGRPRPPWWARAQHRDDRGGA